MSLGAWLWWLRFDRRVAAPGESSHEELISLLVQRDARIAAQDAQITALSTQVADLLEANEQWACKLASVEHLLSRNSRNSSSPPSQDDDAGRMPPAEKPNRRGTGPKRKRGKQPEAAGTNLAFIDNPTKRVDRFPQGRCECGHDLAQAVDLGVVDRYQQHEIPQISVTITQYDQHRVRCGAAGPTPPSARKAPGPLRWAMAR